MASRSGGERPRRPVVGAAGGATRSADGGSGCHARARNWRMHGSAGDAGRGAARRLRRGPRRRSRSSCALDGPRRRSWRGWAPQPRRALPARAPARLRRALPRAPAGARRPRPMAARRRPGASTGGRPARSPGRSATARGRGVPVGSWRRHYRRVRRTTRERRLIARSGPWCRAPTRAMRRFLAPPRPPPALSTGIGDGHRKRESGTGIEKGSGRSPQAGRRACRYQERSSESTVRFPCSSRSSSSGSCSPSAR